MGITHNRIEIDTVKLAEIDQFRKEIEEYTNVISCAIALELKPNADISVWKWERHKKRLEEMEGK